MAKIFIGRRKELATLATQYDDPRSKLLPIYGRRRIGKSELILHFLQHKPGLYFLGQKATAEANLKGFCQMAAQFHHDDLLRRSASWEEALRETVKHWRGNGKLIITLDEFQWTAQASPELLSIIQGLWDREWRENGKVMLLLCGSQIGFMERDVLGKESPLYGRRTGQLPMYAFNHLEAAQFHPGLQTEDRALIYFMTGGIAYYLREFEHRSIEENIRECFLDQHSVLSLEPDFLLREELREVGPYYSILMAIASGARRHKDIARELGGDTHNLNYYLKQLERIGYVGKRHPVQDSVTPKRQVCYEISDALLRFWFHFIYPHESQIRSQRKDLAFQTIIKPGLAAYWGNCFERLCRESLPRIYSSEGVSGWSAIGEYWDKNVQIDVVGIRNDHWVDLGECRWGPVSSLPELRAELAAKVLKFPNKLNHSLGQRLFVREGPKRRPATGETKLHTLADLYHLPAG